MREVVCGAAAGFDEQTYPVLMTLSLTRSASGNVVIGLFTARHSTGKAGTALEQL